MLVDGGRLLQVALVGLPALALVSLAIASWLRPPRSAGYIAAGWPLIAAAAWAVLQAPGNAAWVAAQSATLPLVTVAGDGAIVALLARRGDPGPRLVVWPAAVIIGLAWLAVLVLLVVQEEGFGTTAAWLVGVAHVIVALVIVSQVGTRASPAGSGSKQQVVALLAPWIVVAAGASATKPLAAGGPALLSWVAAALLLWSSRRHPTSGLMLATALASTALLHQEAPAAPSLVTVAAVATAINVGAWYGQAPMSRPWRLAGATTVVLAAFLAVNVAVAAVSTTAFGASMGVLAAVLAGAFLSYGFLVGSSGGYFAFNPGSQPEHLERYRRRLAADIAAGFGPEEARERLAAARVELGVSSHDHALLDYATRAAVDARVIDPHALEPGQLYGGRYRVRSRLGQGATATTYRAWDESLQQEVVLKAVQAAGTGSGATWLQEARGMARFDHPHILRIHNIEQTGNVTMLVTEYAAGGTLADRLRDGPVPVGAWRELATALLDALAAMHEAGLVHRDVKPANILYRGDGTPVLGDLGAVQESRDGHTMMTYVPGDAAGTAAYMSPEAARGEPVDAAADQYGAALTLYEAATGRCVLMPNPGEAAFAVQMRAADPPPLDCVLPPALQGLESWFATALAPEAANRYASVPDMVAALQHGLRGGP